MNDWMDERVTDGWVNGGKMDEFHLSGIFRGGTERLEVEAPGSPCHSSICVGQRTQIISCLPCPKSGT